MTRKNSILTEIGNYSHMVEPHPKIDIRTVDDTTGNFYCIVKVEKRITVLPHAIKDKGQFFVRVGASSRPASRSIILNLYTNYIQRRVDVVRIKISVELLRDSILFTSSEIRLAQPANPVKLPLIDTGVVKNAIIPGEWFLSENNLYGKVSTDGSYTWGLHAIGLLLGFANIVLSLAMKRGVYGRNIAYLGIATGIFDIIGAIPIQLDPF